MRDDNTGSARRVKKWKKIEEESQPLYIYVCVGVGVGVYIHTHTHTHTHMRESTVYSAYSENGKRGERDGASECNGETRRRRRRRKDGREGGRARGREGMQQQARVIDVKRVHSCLDVVILNGRRMDRSRAIRLNRTGRLCTILFRWAMRDLFCAGAISIEFLPGVTRVSTCPVFSGNLIDWAASDRSSTLSRSSTSFTIGASSLKSRVRYLFMLPSERSRWWKQARVNRHSINRLIRAGFKKAGSPFLKGAITFSADCIAGWYIPRGFSPLGCWGVFRCLATTPSKSALWLAPSRFSCLSLSSHPVANQAPFRPCHHTQPPVPRLRGWTVIRGAKCARTVARAKKRDAATRPREAGTRGITRDNLAQMAQHQRVYAQLRANARDEVM